MLKVMKTPCNQCLFTNNKIVSDERRMQILQEITINQQFFTCHKATMTGTDHCCKNFYDKLGYTSQTIRTAQRLNMVEFSLPKPILE
jgi:hypothetical protein